MAGGQRVSRKTELLLAEGETALATRGVAVLLTSYLRPCGVRMAGEFSGAREAGLDLPSQLDLSKQLLNSTNCFRVVRTRSSVCSRSLRVYYGSRMASARCRRGYKGIRKDVV